MPEVGTNARGQRVSIDLFEPSHLAIQGATRSGKSVFLYGLLGRLADREDVAVAGFDPSGILLSPWKGHPGGELLALGTGDLENHAAVAAGLVAMMDARISQLSDPARGVFRDKLENFSRGTPLIVVVLEEYPGLLSALEGLDKARQPAERLAPVFRSNIRRLIQEGAKVGFRVVMIAQRFDASIMGGAERSNLSTRVTFRVDNADAVKMLHHDALPELVEQIKRFSPGMAFLETPARAAQIFRSDLATYEAYASHVWGCSPP